MIREPVYVVEEIGVVVAAAAKLHKAPINYIFGHVLEIVQRLQEKANANLGSAASFPLIALFTDIEKRVQADDGYDGHVALNLVICNYTTPELTSVERLEQNFKKVLYPIKGCFLEALRKSRAFTTGDYDLRYTDIDHYYWGRRSIFESVQGNAFNDYIDAIELKNLQLTVKNKPC